MRSEILQKLCHVTLSLSQSEGSILSSLSDPAKNCETSPTKNPFKEHSCKTALLKRNDVLKPPTSCAKRQTCYPKATKTQVTERILKFKLIHASVIYQFL